MLKIEKLLRKGMPKNLDFCRKETDQYSIMREWQSFLDECQRCLEKTKNRKPIVDFKIHNKTKEGI